jgi:hypothetical protein
MDAWGGLGIFYNIAFIVMKLHLVSKYRVIETLALA